MEVTEKADDQKNHVHTLRIQDSGCWRLPGGTNQRNRQIAALLVPGYSADDELHRPRTVAPPDINGH